MHDHGVKVCPACNREYPGNASTCVDDGVGLVRVDSRDQEAQNLIGTVVDGRYRLERVVGRGGMGTVYACRHVVVGKTFAMKVLRSGVERSEEILQRFIREAQATNAIKSRHICEMSDFGQLPGGAFYVVMELLNGVSLTRALREKRLERASIIHVFRQIANTLEKAHAVGIIHRDLKPDNVLLVEDEADPYFVKIVDFGIAKVLRSKASDLTETGIILGTPYYMSPEQARGELIDHRSDIYALGVMLYRAFTGKLPFIADTQMGVLTRHLSEAPALPSTITKVDPRTERLILRCLEKRPIDRFQSMKDVAEALAALPETPSSQRTDTNPTIDERSPALMAADAHGNQAVPPGAPPRPVLPGSREPTPTKLETPQAQEKARMGQPLPFPHDPAANNDPSAGPGSMPPPLPAGGTNPAASWNQRPVTASNPRISAMQGTPISGAASAHGSGAYTALGPTSSGSSGAYPASHDGTLDPSLLASGDSHLPHHQHPESLTNRGVVSSRMQSKQQKRKARRAAFGLVLAAVGVIVAGTAGALLLIKQDPSDPTPAATTPPASTAGTVASSPTKAEEAPTPSASAEEAAPGGASDTSSSPEDSASPPSTASPPASSATPSAEKPTTAPAAPPPRVRRPWRPRSPAKRPKPTAPADDIRSPFD